MKTYYFSYGSNLNFAQMAKRCPAAVSLRKTTLVNYKLMINAQGVATIVPSEGAIVEGGLWHITSECELSLDHFEGVADRVYIKESVLLTCGTNALTYVATETIPGKPYEGYLERILDGAGHFELSHAYVEFLKTFK